MEKSSVHRIISSVKRYFGLQREYVLLSFAEKLTILLTAMVVGGIIMSILFVSVIFFSLALSSWIAEMTGSMPLGYVVVACLFLLLCLIIFLNRKRWIANPIARFLATTLLDDRVDETSEKE